MRCHYVNVPWGHQDFGQPSLLVLHLWLPPCPFPPSCSSLTVLPSPCPILGVFDIYGQNMGLRSCSGVSTLMPVGTKQKRMTFISFQEIPTTWEHLYNIRALKSPILWSDCSVKEWLCFFSQHVFPHGTSIMVPVRQLCQPAGETVTRYLLMIASGGWGPASARMCIRAAPLTPSVLPVTKDKIYVGSLSHHSDELGWVSSGLVALALLWGGLG